MAFSQVFHLAPVNNTWVVTNGEQLVKQMLYVQLP